MEQLFDKVALTVSHATSDNDDPAIKCIIISHWGTAAFSFSGELPTAAVETPKGCRSQKKARQEARN